MHKVSVSSTHFLHFHSRMTRMHQVCNYRSYIFRGHVIALQPCLLATWPSSLRLQFHPWNKEAKRGVTLVALRSLSGGRSTEFLFNIVKRNCNHISILMGGVEQGVTTRAFYRDAFIKERSLGMGRIEWVSTRWLKRSPSFASGQKNKFRLEVSVRTSD